MRALVACMVLLAALVASRTASAHELRTGVLLLEETAPGTFAVQWTLRRGGPPLRPLEVQLPSTCRTRGPARIAPVAGAIRERWVVACGDHGLRGTEVGVAGLASAESAYVEVRLLGGTAHRAALSAGAPTLAIPRDPATHTARTAIGSSIALGARHVLTGFDHLLFLLVLLLWAQRGWRIVGAVTGFTVGHSATLALAATGAVTLPSEPVEALIALSVVLLAAEVLRRRAAPTSESAERLRVWIPATAFGLLHGLGFASALGDLGLPPDQLVVTLLGFNVGVELGQLGFVALAVVAWTAARRVTGDRAFVLARTGAYAVGTVAAFWTLDRLAWLWGG